MVLTAWPMFLATLKGRSCEHPRYVRESASLQLLAYISLVAEQEDRDRQAQAESWDGKPEDPAHVRLDVDHASECDQ